MALNAGSSAICLAMSLMEGSSSILFDLAHVEGRAVRAGHHHAGRHGAVSGRSRRACRSRRGSTRACVEGRQKWVFAVVRVTGKHRGQRRALATAAKRADESVASRKGPGNRRRRGARGTPRRAHAGRAGGAEGCAKSAHAPAMVFGESGSVCACRGDTRGRSGERRSSPARAGQAARRPKRDRELLGSRGRLMRRESSSVFISPTKMYNAIERRVANDSRGLDSATRSSSAAMIGSS